MDLATIKNKILAGIDLLIVQPTMYFVTKIEDEDESNYELYRVKEYESGRIDLIANKFYGDASKSDLILKFNNISDPFSVVEGEVLKIPDYDIRFKSLERLSNKEENAVKEQFVNTKRLSKKDESRIEALKAKYDKDNLLPPNVVPVGKKTYMFKPGGKVSFGAAAQSDPVVDKVMKDKKFSEKTIEEKKQSRR